MDLNKNNRENQQQSGRSDNGNGWENARENWAQWEEQQKKKNWDHWDSNASHSSYYNQPTHPPFDQGFSLAALICGLLSITLGCCYLSLPVGAMGILFVLLCHRHGKPLNSNCRTGLCLSVIGCIYGIFILVYAFSHTPAQPTDSTYLFQQHMNQMYERLLQDGSGATN